MKNSIQLSVQRTHQFSFFKAICFIVFTLLCVCQINAQDISLTGTVYSNIDKEPLPGASIVLNNSIRGTETGINGKFEFENLSVGDQVTIHSMGYENKVITIKNTSQPLRIYLNENGEVLNTVNLGAADTNSQYKTKRGFWRKVTSIF